MPDSAAPGRPVREQLEGLVDWFLGFSQPGNVDRQQKLEDELMPAFLDDARVSWFLSEPHQLKLQCMYDALHRETEVAGDKISSLKELLAEMRVLDLLQAAASSPDLPVLTELSHAYEVRLLNHAGHPRASDEYTALIRKVVANPGMLAEAPIKLDQAAEATLAAHRELGTNQTHNPPYTPKIKALFSSLGVLFSGLVLLAANGTVTPTVLCSQEMSLTLLSSLAGGIAAIDKGIGDIRYQVSSDDTSG